MSIIFLHNVLLPLLLLGAFPLILHLFSRAKPPLYKFSSNKFLELIVRRTKRVRKPQDILLLILRTLLFLTIILMFLQPLFFSDSKFAGILKKRNIVIIVDASASMGYVEGGQTRFASACAEASEVLRGLSSRDMADVIYLKSNAEALFPSLGMNFNYLSSELRKAQVSNEPGNVQASLRKAVELLEKAGDGINEICIISDFQRSQWKDTLPLKVSENIAITFLKVAKSEASNQVITRVSSSPILPLLGEDVTFNCEIRNFSPSPRRLTLYFEAGELHESLSLLVPAWGSATPQFQMSGKELESEKNSSIPAKEGLPGVRKPGTFSYDFSIGEDNFPEDNRRWGILKVAKSLKIGIAEFAPYPGKIWKRALKVFPWIDVKTVSAETLDVDEHYDFLFLSGWNGTASEKIQTLMEHGTVVICAPAEGVDLKKLNIFNNKQFLVKTKESVRVDKALRSFKLKISAAKDKVFAIFANGEFGDPVGGFIKRRLQLPAKLYKNQTNVISYTDGVPALIRSITENSNQFYIWNITLDPKYSNFANRIQFVPLIAELLLSSRFGIGDLGYLADHTPNSQLVKGVGFAGSVNDISLTDPQGEDVPLKIEATTSNNKRKTNNGAMLSLISNPVSELGIYNWNFLTETIDSSIVNFAVSESDLRTIPRSELSVHGTSVASGAGSINNIHKGVMLWPFLLALAVLLALGEGTVMFWSERGGKE